MRLTTISFFSPPAHQRGVSLVELMVGVTIGIIGVVMMFQLLENWEVRKRTTAAGSDAQTSGSISFYRLQQDIQQGGYGFGMANRIGCTVNGFLGANFNFTLAPVMIIDGGVGGAPDSIQVLYGSSNSLMEERRIDAQSATSKTLVTTKSITSGIQPGDLMIVEPDTGNCGLVEVTNTVQQPDGKYAVQHVNGSYTNIDGTLTPSTYNAPAGFTGSVSTGGLYNLGSRPRLNVWDLDSATTPRTLRVANALAAEAAAEAGEGIVNIQAQYGLDTDNNTVVDAWQDTALTSAQWPTLRAMRVSLLARSQQYEKDGDPSTPARDPVTIVAPSWIGGTFTMTDLDGSAPSSDNSPDDWRHYRYRVYETTISIRNMVWGTAP